MVRKTSGLSAGDYLIATDSKGCTDTETITIGYGILATITFVRTVTPVL
jgi:hypothetical protein